MARVEDREAYRRELNLTGSLSKSLCHKLAFSNRRKPSDQQSFDASLGESFVKASMRERSLNHIGHALSHTANIQRRADQQLDVSVRKLNLQMPIDRERDAPKKVIEARRLNFEGINFSKPKNQESQRKLGEDHTAVVLNRISSKLDTILKKNREGEANLKTEDDQFKNESYLELSGKASQLHSRPPIPPKDLVRPVWVSFGSRSRSKASNGSNGSKDDDKKEERNDNDSSLSLSKKSGYRIRYFPQKPIVNSRARLDRSLSNHNLEGGQDLTASNINNSIEVLDRPQRKVPHLLNTSSSLKQTSFSILKMLDSKGLDSKRKLSRQQSQNITGKLLFSGKENKPMQGNLLLPNQKQSIENVKIEKKNHLGQKKKDNRTQAQKTFQLEEETDRKQAPISSNRLAATSGDFHLSTFKKDVLSSNTMSIQVSKFELNEEHVAPRPSSVAQFFNDHMQTKVSPIQKRSGVDYITITPKIEEDPPALASCACRATFSHIKRILKHAEIRLEESIKSSNFIDSDLQFKQEAHQSEKLLRLLVSNKKSAVKLIALFMKRLVKNRKLSALAKIFSRYKHNKKQDSRKAIVIGR